MPFIGKQQATGFISSTKQDLTPDGSTVAFTLDNAAASANDIEVFVGNVRQEPTDAYSVSGTTLTMTAAPASGVNFYVIHKQANQSATVPAAGTSVPGDFNVSGNLGVGTGSSSHLIHAVGADSSRLIVAENATGVKTGIGQGTNDGRIGNITNHGLVFLINDTEKARITTAGQFRLSTSGITFNGDTSTANELDDYEEGTWTPTFIGAGGSITIGGYDIQEGIYTKIGRMVYIQGGLRTTSVSGVSSGTYDIAGLPYTVTNPTAGSSGIIFCGSQQSWTNAPMQFTTINNATTMRGRQGLAHGASTYTNGNTTDFDTSSGSRNRVFFSGWYETDG